MIDDNGQVHCPRCKQLLTARPGNWDAVYSYEDCLRRCDSCGIGYSNAQRDSTIIFRDPLENLPEQVRDGLEAALEQSLNVRTRTTKRRRLGFSTSEDAITWALFAWLAREARPILLRLGSRLFGFADVQDPIVLLWGVPVPPSAGGDEIRHRLVQILDTLGEDPTRRSEPDVVIDYGRNGLVFVEVKWRAPNDVLDKSGQSKFNRYVNDTRSFATPELAKDSGLYELVRNWRIGWDLAAGRAFRLVNLGPDTLFQSPVLDVLEEALPRGDDARFQRVTWGEFLHVVERESAGLPPWLHAWLLDREVS